MAKATKRTKKFVKNKLDAALQQRRAAKKKTKFVKNKERRPAAEEDEDDHEEEAADQAEEPGMGVDEFLRGGFQEGMGDDDEEEEMEDDDDLEDVEALDDENEHAQDLAKLAETDPEFFKYLQENDKDLLKFGQGDDEEVLDAEEEEEERVLTMDMLRQWQRQLLRHYSPRALRRLLLAFRAAVHTGEKEVAPQAYRIDDSAVFAKLVLTTLKYMPVVMEHHVPYKKGADGHFKVPTHTPKWHALYRPVRSYFLSVVQLLRTVAEPDMVYAALTESAKMVPYLHQDRRVTRDYVRALLEQWATGEDRIRLAAFSCVYVTTASAMDDDMIDFCLKSAYHTLIRHTRQTKPHTLEAIALMKNTACELFTLHPEAAYQQAFGFIRQLAISLRNCLKLKSQEQFQAVLNWPYVHCLDFWSRVLAKTCHTDVEQGVPSHMRPLIYPLVQVALGVVRLVPMSRYFPLRLHVLQAMLRLMQATGVYVPLAPLVLEVWESPEFQRKAKGATLKPLDLDTTFRAPAAYVRTRIYGDQLAEEFGFVMLEFLASQAAHIAFPELAIPITVQMRRLLKGSPSVRLSETLRPLLDKIQQNSTWVSQQRAQFEFAPDDQRQVDAFLDKAQGRTDAPLQQALRLARKVREQKRRLLEKTAHVVDDDEA
ncbi:Nucleolar Complex 2 protein [Malassezia caprae]|uniref:Nucleolar Complex 2 protein n=1 Tax=Malassezia caprae TaxID=1381934 RepID=A0AAF0IYG1_9BASI|nr:Nucleolar Complex 2 protein [Malassezia caprae]